MTTTLVYGCSVCSHRERRLLEDVRAAHWPFLHCPRDDRPLEVVRTIESRRTEWRAALVVAAASFTLAFLLVWVLR